MRITSFIVVFIVAIVGIPMIVSESIALYSHDTDIAKYSIVGAIVANAESMAATKADAVPVRLVIPSIKLDSTVEGLGVNDKGEMAVPDGRTNLVGWYSGG